MREQCRARISVLPPWKSRSKAAVQCGQDFFPIGDLIFDHHARIVGFVAQAGWIADGDRLRLTRAERHRRDHDLRPPLNPVVAVFRNSARLHGLKVPNDGVKRATWRWGSALPPTVIAECPKHGAMDVVIDFRVVVREQSENVARIEEELARRRQGARPAHS